MVSFLPTRCLGECVCSFWKRSLGKLANVVANFPTVWANSTHAPACQAAHPLRDDEAASAKRARLNDTTPATPSEVAQAAASSSPDSTGKASANRLPPVPPPMPAFVHAAMQLERENKEAFIPKEVRKEVKKHADTKKKSAADKTAATAAALKTAAAVKKALKKKPAAAVSAGKSEPPAPAPSPSEPQAGVEGSEWFQRWKHILDELPVEAHPQRQPRGEKSYTLRAKSGARIEILVKNRAFYLKRSVLAEELKVGPNVHFLTKSSVQETWNYVKQVTGFDEQVPMAMF